MTHDELLVKINNKIKTAKEELMRRQYIPYLQSLRAIVELHSPFDGYCQRCTVNNWGELRQEYPCDEIQAIEKELT